MLEINNMPITKTQKLEVDYFKVGQDAR